MGNGSGVSARTSARMTTSHCARTNTRRALLILRTTTTKAIDGQKQKLGASKRCMYVHKLSMTIGIVSMSQIFVC